MNPALANEPGFRLSTAKDRCSNDEGARCQFYINILCAERTYARSETPKINVLSGILKIKNVNLGSSLYHQILVQFLYSNANLVFISREYTYKRNIVVHSCANSILFCLNCTVYAVNNNS